MAENNHIYIVQVMITEYDMHKNQNLATYVDKNIQP